MYSWKFFLITFLWLSLLGHWQPALAQTSQIEPRSAQVVQTPLLGSTVTKYVTPLPTFIGARVAAGTALDVSYHEFQQKVLPDTFYSGLPASITPFPGITFNPQAGTYVWGFKVGLMGPLYPGFTVEAQKGTATAVTYTNLLGTATTFPILQRYLTVDQTLHFANPLNVPPSFLPYSGPQPVVPHLHGGEVRSDFDGGPDSWWTPGGEGPISTPPPVNSHRGPYYRTNIYNYPNSQEAATIWFHDHALGMTRTNVYAGIAAFWFIRDQYDTGIPGTGLNLPAGNYEAEIVFQDRQFDTNGQLFFPDGNPPGAGLNGNPPNPTVHPFWNPEFFGDVIVVNGRSWPFYQVEPRRYRFRLLNGSNARFYEIRIDNNTPNPGPPIYVIGTDGGLLNAPAITSSTPTNRLLIGPGERYDVIVDFTRFQNSVLTVMNTANGPFPGGAPPDPATTVELMQFQVNLGLTGADTSFNPATPGATLRGGVGQPPAILRLADNGVVAPGVKVNKTRQLVLKEVMGPGGPLEVLLNNTDYRGLREGSLTPIPGSRMIGPNYLNELPRVGSTEVWELINISADAHPIHLHLVQFQLINRQPINAIAYTAAYDAAFAGGVTIDGYGPPNYYNTPNADGAVGGNPPISPHLLAVPELPLPQENGWKDTVISYPGTVTRIIARWAPQNIPLNQAVPGKNLFPFDATYGSGYVWHCHILDHEDNEMMRPYIPTLNPNTVSADLLLLLP
jgi:spore coat protein A, manganese oxidase